MIVWIRCLRCGRAFTKRALDLFCPDCTRTPKRRGR